MAYYTKPSGTTVSQLNKTADYTLTSGDSDKVITNLGASGTVVFTLPAASTAGLRYTFKTMAAQIIKISRAGSDTIKLVTGSYTQLVSKAMVAQSITLESDGTSAWIASAETQPEYVSRGDVADDFNLGNLTDDGTWYALDYSAHIPATARGNRAEFEMRITHSGANAFAIRPVGHSGADAVLRCQNGSNIWGNNGGICDTNAGGYIEYWFFGTATTAELTCRGYWVGGWTADSVSA